MTLSFEDVRAAAQRLQGQVRRTPTLDLPRVEGRAALTLKLECLQDAGSFKIRGATNRILLEQPQCTRVVAASGGNHGAAVALAGRRFGLEADIFVPDFAADHKLRQIESYGARVHQFDEPFTEITRRAAEHAVVHDGLFIHPFDDPKVLAGQGTLGLELAEQCPTVTKIVIAVGGGGLAAGVTVALNGAAEVVAVEPTSCPSLSVAFERGSPIEAPVGGIAADALGAPVVGEHAFDVLSAAICPPLLLEDDAIVRAQRALWRSFRIAAEPAAACAWAGLEQLASLTEDEHVVVVVCGGNVELGQFMRAVLGDLGHRSEEKT